MVDEQTPVVNSSVTTSQTTLYRLKAGDKMGKDYGKMPFIQLPVLKFRSIIQAN